MKDPRLSALMEKAAQFTTVTLICPKSVWEHIEHQTFANWSLNPLTGKRFLPGDRVLFLDDGKVSVELTGPDLAEVLDHIHRAANSVLHLPSFRGKSEQMYRVLADFTATVRNDGASKRIPVGLAEAV